MAYDVNLEGDDIRTTERNADVLLNACKNISLAVNTRKIKYMRSKDNKQSSIGDNWFTVVILVYKYKK